MMAGQTNHKSTALSSGGRDFYMVEIWDYALVLFVVMSIVFGHKTFDFIALALFVPLVLQVFLKDRKTGLAFGGSDWWFVVLAGQYLLVGLAIAWIYPPDNASLLVREIEVAKTWLLSLLVFGLMVVRVVIARNLENAWRAMAPAGLMIGFLFLTADYFTDAFTQMTNYSGGTSDRCRVSGFVFNANIPPVFFTLAAVGSFIGWAGFSKHERYLRYVLVVMSVVVASAYTGARMTLIVQVAAFGSLSLVLPLRADQARIGLIGVLGALGLLGLGSGLLIDFIQGCGFSDRLGLLGSAVTDMKPAAGGYSISSRYDAFQKALAAIVERPLTGYGMAFEKHLADPIYHIHNQYLTWLIWGGIATLVSGLAFCVSATLVPVMQLGRDGIIVALAASGVLMLNSLTDSLLYHPYVNLQYVLFLTLFFGLGREMIWKRHLQRVQVP